jgi:NAD+--asparagine ADP-ribosyltransferase
MSVIIAAATAAFIAAAPVRIGVYEGNGTSEVLNDTDYFSAITAAAEEAFGRLGAFSHFFAVDKSWNQSCVGERSDRRDLFLMSSSTVPWPSKHASRA